MQLTTVLLLGASPLALTAPVSNGAYSQTTDSNKESAHSKRQLQDPGALTEGLGEVLGPLSFLTGGAALGKSEAALKGRDNKDIESEQLEALGALSGLLGPLSGILAPGGVLKGEDGEALPTKELATRQPIELDEVTDLLQLLSGALGGVGGLGGVLKRGEDGILAKGHVNPSPVTHDFERRQDPLTSLISGLLITLAPMVGVLTDPISPLLGGKGWNRRVKKDGGFEALIPVTESSDSLAALVADATGPLAPVLNGKGYEGGISKRDSSPLGGLAGLGSASTTLTSSLNDLGQLVGPNTLAVAFGEITDPLSGLLGGHGYPTK